jgi:hypothetical protein
MPSFKGIQHVSNVIAASKLSGLIAHLKVSIMRIS